MTSLIQQIQMDIIDSKQSTVNVLYKAKIVAFKLNQTDFLKWINCELEGYQACPINELPSYRIIHGCLMGQPRYGSWTSIMIQSPDAERVVSKFGCSESLSQISHQIARAGERDELLHIPGGEQQKLLRQWINESMQYAVRFSVAQYASIIDAVRSSLLNWVLELENSGVLGNNLEFSDKEREVASSMTQYVFAQNIGMVGSGAEQKIFGTLNQSMSIDAATKISAILSAIADLIDRLPTSEQSDARHAVEELQNHLQNPSDIKAKEANIGILQRIAEASVSSVAGHALLKLLEELAKFWPSGL